MSESESSSSQDLNGAKSESSFMQTDAQEIYSIKRILKFPDFTFPEYLVFVSALGHEVEVKTGIYHLVPMVQSAHESGNGNSGLARKYGNLFGVKATQSWKAAGHPVANLPTWEVIGGKRIDVKQEFRAYETWRDSFLDWAHLISTLSVYKKAYELLKDKATVPAGIEAMAPHFATDPAYARKLLDGYSQSIKEGIL